ncbi:MAG: hypothetical protein ACREHG_03800 [Candidatus Saccharimonadales bacterium]
MSDTKGNKANDIESNWKNFQDEDMVNDGWDNDLEPLYMDGGIKIDWSRTPVFIGYYLGSEPKETVDAQTGERGIATLMMFRDRDSVQYCSFANYALQQALDKGLTEGAKIKIVNHGKEDIGGGQTLNRMSVYTGPA